VPKNYFDQRIAERYETYWREQQLPQVVDPVVTFLRDLAGGGAALEFGIGTGRIALPLSQRGVPVHGIDLSEAMVAKMSTRPGASDVGVTVGDFSTTKVDGDFSLVYLVANTIANLTTQEQQVACFCNAAAHLKPGGCFVIELWIPELQRLPPGQTISPIAVTPTHVGFDEIDVATQTLFSHHYWVIDGQLETFSAPFRYVWPAELDLMARIAGMTLRERWSDWRRAPFTSASISHVSVWEKPS